MVFGALDGARGDEMDFGTRLRQAREQQSRSLHDIAEATKISALTLEALETGDFSRLPGGIFARAFVRTYAAEVGLDPEEMLREFVRLHPAAAREPLADTLADARPSTRARWMVVAGTIIALLAVAAAVIYWSVAVSTSGESETEVRRTVSQDRALVATAMASDPDGTPSEPEAAPLPLPASGAATSSGSGGGGDTPFSLAIHPRGRVWVRLVVDGSVRIAREMGAGDREILEVTDAAYVEVGDAGAFDFSINGEPGRMLGGAGEVVRTRIDHANLETLVAR